VIYFLAVAQHLLRVRRLTSRCEPYWTIIGAPIIQEIIFRFLPYQYFYLESNDFWLIGIVSSVLYALIHFYFGFIFTLGTFLLGLVLWVVMVRFGLIEAILLHSFVDVIVWFTWRRKNNKF